MRTKFSISLCVRNVRAYILYMIVDLGPVDRFLLCADWLTFPLTIVNFDHVFIQPAPDQERSRKCKLDLNLQPSVA